jgi:UTP--glucose-1-phosphate uridylyltransferase
MKKRVCKAVFPAAGLGTRFLPATKAQPKEMMPLVDKPIIQYGVEEALASGCDQIIIVTGRGKSAIEDHFDVSYELEKMLEERGKTDLLAIVRQISEMIHIAYVRQKEAMGLGHAVLMARELVGDEPFAVILADDIIDAQVPCLKQMIEIYNETGCSVLATQVIEGKAISSYGVLDVKPVEGKWKGRLFEVQNLVEKPKVEDAPSNLAIIGRYILTPAIFEMLDSTPLGRRRIAAHRRPEAVTQEGKNLRIHLRGQAARYRRQVGLPESDGGVCLEARRPRRRFPGVSADA